MATESDSVNTGALGTIVAVGALVTLAVALAVTALVRSAEQSVAAERNSTVNPRPFRELHAEQQGQLNQPPAWVDKAKGVVSIPISSAMDLVVSDYTRDPHLATPVSSSPSGGEGAESAASPTDGAPAGAAAEQEPSPESADGENPPKPNKGSDPQPAAAGDASSAPSDD